jgi:hypothetical protein
MQTQTFDRKTLKDEVVDSLSGSEDNIPAMKKTFN